MSSVRPLAGARPESFDFVLQTRPAWFLTDSVARPPIRDADEAEAFGSNLARFVDALADEAQRLAERFDVLRPRVSSQPQLRAGVRVLTFQERTGALAFAGGSRRTGAAAA